MEVLEAKNVGLETDLREIKHQLEEERILHSEQEQEMLLLKKYIPNI